jgi:peptidoglycan/LPS O-acetylase OafA/YrhL
LRHARVTPGYLANYAFRRSLRLDPPYWVTIGVVLLVHAVLSVHLGYLSPLDDPSPMETPLSWRLIVAHVFYVQNILGYDNLSAGLWTLCIEVQFYLLYVVGLGVAQRVPARNKRTASDAGPLGLLLVFAPLAVLSLFVWNREGLGEVWLHRVLGGDMWITHFFCMFFLGASAWWVLDGRVPAAVFWSGAALFAVRLAWDPAPDLAVALAAAVAIFVVGRAGRLGSTLNWGWIQYLGRLSYSLYLIHFPVNHVVWTIGYELSDRSPTPAAAALWMLLGLVASLAAAHALYVLVEAPSVRLSARFKRRV